MRIELGFETTPPNYPVKPKSDLFRIVLLIAAIAGFLIRCDVGRKTLIDFDEWQHVFMAGTPRWSDLFFELRTNAHPPLFFLPLRALVRLGYVPLYRSVSIAAGTGSVILVGLIARSIFRSFVVQALCVFGFALSASAIFISIEIRSYQLMVFFLLAAFWAWLDLFPLAQGRVSRRSAFTFAICCTLAILSHYSAIFFVAASIAVPLISAVVFPRARALWIAATGKNSLPAIAAAIAFPCVVFTVEYFVHIRHELMLGYDPEFYMGGVGGESMAGFLLRNSRNFFNLFSPIAVPNAAVFLITLGVVGAIVSWIYSRHMPEQGAANLAPLLFAVVIVAELMILSLARKYPFGGFLRHQYIAAPFLFLAAYAILDALVDFPGFIMQRAIPALLAVAMIVNLVAAWPRLVVFPGQVLLQDEFNTWKANFADRKAVYLDHWGVIGFFIHTSNIPRTFVRTVDDAAQIDEYRLPDGTLTFYDKTRDNLKFTDPSIYRSFAACLRQSGIHELSLFFFTAGNEPLSRSPRKIEELIIKNAGEEGLTTTKVIAGNTSVFAGFRLKSE